MALQDKTVIARIVSLMESKAKDLGLEGLFCRRSGREQEKSTRAEREPREISRPYAGCNTEGGKQV